MKYFQQIENERMVQVVASNSVDTCVEYFGGEWIEISAPPFVGWTEDNNFRPFPVKEPTECLLSTYDHLLDEWIILK